MRRFFTAILCITAMLMPSAVPSQVIGNYDLGVESSEFVPAVNMAVLASGSADGEFSGVVFDGNGAQTTALEGSGVSIGFTFRFGAHDFTRFAVAANGYVLLGDDGGIYYNVPSEYSLSGVFSSAQNIFGMVLTDNLVAGDDTQVGYSVHGDDGNRVLTIQYLNLHIDYYGSIVATMSVQYRLYEADGRLEFVFSGFRPEGYMRSQTLLIGLAGRSGDILMKDSSFGDDVVSPNAYGLQWSEYSYPADGIMYVWTPPQPCETPTAQPSGLRLSASSTAIEGSFVNDGEGDHYLVMISKSDQLTTLPADGTRYNAGDSIGNVRVIDYTDSPLFATGDILEGSTTYYIYVMSANSACMDGPKYMTASPLTGSIRTFPACPLSMRVEVEDSTSLTLSVTGNTAGDDFLVAMSDAYATTSYGSMQDFGRFGTPTGELAEGESIDGGGMVVYKGPSKDGIRITGLDKNNIYHFRAWSVDKAGQYSTTAINRSAVTAATLPWAADLQRFPQQRQPAGWTFSDNTWRTARNTSYGSPDTTPYLEAYDIPVDTEGGTDTWFETPYIYLGKTANRLVFSLLMTDYAGYTQVPMNFEEGDEMLVYITEDDRDYTLVAMYNKDNMPTMEDVSTYRKIYTTFYEGTGRMVRLKVLFRLSTERSTATLRVRDISVEEKPACDYPVDFRLDTDLTFGNQAGIVWQPQGEENAWEIRYRKSGTTKWDRNIIVREYPYVLSGLDGLTDYEVQVRARCSDEQQSVWSDKLTFRSGPGVPFMLDFSKETEAPEGWTAKKGELASPTVLEDGGNWSFSAGYWSTGVTYTSYGEEDHDWYISPVIDLGDGSYNCNASFTITTGYSRSTETSLQLVVAPDGEMFSEENVVLAINNDEISSTDYVASLRGYSGKVRLGLLFVHKGGSYSDLRLNTFGVTYSCDNDIDGLAANGITDTSAVISWTSGADEVLLFCRKSGDNTRDWQKVSDGTIELTGLLPATEYEIGVTKSCEPGDTAKVRTVSFVTQPECVEPSELVVEQCGEDMAVLSWTADEGNRLWTLAYRPADEEMWSEIHDIAATAYTLTGLASETVYLWRVQAVCGLLVSDWATGKVFRTGDGSPGTGIGEMTDANIRIAVSGDMLDIANPAGLYIKDVRVYDEAGRLLRSFDVCADANAFVRLGVRGKVVVVVNFDGGSRTLHTLIR